MNLRVVNLQSDEFAAAQQAGGVTLVNFLEKNPEYVHFVALDTLNSSGYTDRHTEILSPPEIYNWTG